MAIASNLPFEFRLKRVYTGYDSKETTGWFYYTEEEAWNHNQESYHIEENEEIEVIFNSTDVNARLYLEALDIVPPEEADTYFDENGQLYRKPMADSFFLYKHQEGYDALCIDTF